MDFLLGILMESRLIFRFVSHTIACRPNLCLGLSLGLLCVALGGCTTIITPPRAPKDPVDVYLILDAAHRGLVLRDASDQLIEYGYGDWDWYALRHDSWYHVFDTVLWPTQGTLGRVETGSISEEQLRRRFHWMEIHRIPVDRTLNQELGRRLAADYESGQAEEIYNAAYNMHFVPYERSYSGWANCNDMVVEWLEALGCTATWRPIRIGLELDDSEE